MTIRQQFPDFSERRKQLRRDSTLPEALLWRHLRSRRTDSRKFRRQQQLGPYIVDFYCAAVKLVIEIDGGQHYEAESLAYDAERSAYLGSRGLRVLRFTNTEVLQQIEGVMARIAEAGAPSP